MCYVQAQIVTTTMTKTTLTDELRMTLPIAAANVNNNVGYLDARLENATAVLNAGVALTTPNVAYVTFRNLPSAAASAIVTYALLSLGALTNTVTFHISGWYEIQ